MVGVAETKGLAPEAAELQRVAELLGGTRVLRHKVNTPLDAHEMLIEGLPGNALKHLLDNLRRSPPCGGGHRGEKSIMPAGYITLGQISARLSVLEVVPQFAK